MLLLAAIPLLAHAAPEPARLAVVVTSNVGLAGEEPLRWADADGERLAEVLVELGGFRPEDVEHVADATVDDVTEALGRATVRASALRDARRPTTVLVYYTGHAGTDGLHLHGEVLPLPALKTAARVVPASQRIFAIDACQSGQLFRTQGARLLDVRVEPVDFTPPPDEAWITSSGPEEWSFEADRRRGALFTHFFVSGARGAADANGDQAVTLGELAAFVGAQTSEAAAGLGQVQRPRWAGGLDGFVVGDLSRASAGVEVAGPVADPVLVVSYEDARVVAEVPRGAGGFLALPPGRYQLVSTAPGSRPRVAEVSLAAGERDLVDLSERLAATRGVRTKGGLVVREPWSVSAGYALTSSPDGAGAHGAWLGVHDVLGRGHEAGLVLGGSYDAFSNVHAAGSTTRWSAAAEWTWDATRGAVRGGPGLRLGGGSVLQRATRQPSPTWGAWYGSRDGAEARALPLVEARVEGMLTVPSSAGDLRITAGVGAAVVGQVVKPVVGLEVGFRRRIVGGGR